MSLRATRFFSPQGFARPHRSGWKEDLRREVLELEIMIAFFGSAALAIEHLYEPVRYF
jgi:hypothetical protein